MEIERKLRSLKLTNDLHVSVSFDEVITTESESGEDEAGVITNSFNVTSRHEPHKDFIDALKKLRQYALEVCELTVDTKERANWMVQKIKITGDLLMKTSRVVMTVGKEVKTGKVISITTPQVTMYPTTEDKVPYHNADKMSTVIEEIEREVWKYLNGKYALEGQLALFPEKEAIEA